MDENSAKYFLFYIRKIGYLCIRNKVRGVAQLASALAWGARGRMFESSHPDKIEKADFRSAFFV